MTDRTKAEESRNMRSALFTVSFAGFWGQDRLSLEDSIRAAARWGFEGVVIMGKRPHLSPLDVSLDDCDRLADLMRSQGVELAAVAAYTNFTGGMASAEVPFVEMQVEHADALAQRTRRLGGDLLRIFTAYERHDRPFSQQWQTTVRAIRECCRRAEQHGVTIGVQNHHDIAVHTKGLHELLLQVDCPNVIPMYDCWSPFLRGEDLAAGAAGMASRMRLTTVADYIAVPRYRYQPDLVNYAAQDPPHVVAVPMGTGDLNYATFFDALATAGFDGWVSYEMCSPLRDGGSMGVMESYARQFLDYMKPFAQRSARHAVHT